VSVAVAWARNSRDVIMNTMAIVQVDVIRRIHSSSSSSSQCRVGGGWWDGAIAIPVRRAGGELRDDLC